MVWKPYCDIYMTTDRAIIKKV